MPERLTAAPVRRALEVLRRHNFSDGERTEYQREKMAEQDYRGGLPLALSQGEKLGLERGEKQGLAQGILMVLAARGLAINPVARARIEQCRDGTSLRRWIARAALVASAEELFSEG